MSPPTPSLTLKHVEQDFLYFLDLVMGQSAQRPIYEASHCLSSIPPESRMYTRAASISLSALIARTLPLEEIDTNAAAIEFLIDLPATGEGHLKDLESLISQYLASIRRNTAVPMIYHVKIDLCTRDVFAAGQDTAEKDAVYFELRHHGLRPVPEYLVVDLRSNDQRFRALLAAKGATKIIGNFIDYDPGADGWAKEDRLADYRQAIELGCDLVRLS